jgi:hypothetical protein
MLPMSGGGGGGGITPAPFCAAGGGGGGGGAVAGLGSGDISLVTPSPLSGLRGGPPMDAVMLSNAPSWLESPAVRPAAGAIAPRMLSFKLSS